jgi:hypothetical protein
MTKNIVSVTVALLGAGALLTGCNFDQPSSGCIVQDASFANWYAKYDLREGQNLSETCRDLVIKGETWGVFKFTDPEKADSTVLTIRPQGLYSRAPLDLCDTATQQILLKEVEGNQELTSLRTQQLEQECGPASEGKNAQTAYAKLAEEPDTQNFCSTTGWKPASVKPRPAGQVRLDVPPTTSISYQFDGVKVYAAPDAPGTQIGGELTYMRDGCTIQYHVRALWPLTACDPESTIPAESCGEGSGINPVFAVTCDPDLARCVPTKDIPSIK